MRGGGALVTVAGLTKAETPRRLAPFICGPRLAEEALGRSAERRPPREGTEGPEEERP